MADLSQHSFIMAYASEFLMWFYDYLPMYSATMYPLEQCFDVVIGWLLINVLQWWQVMIEWVCSLV
jgi:hypothetical protein